MQVLGTKQYFNISFLLTGIRSWVPGNIYNILLAGVRNPQGGLVAQLALNCLLCHLTG